jgi:hypothetical protein
MVRKTFVTGGVLLLVLAQVSIAEIDQIPLPELVGSYPASRTVTVQLRDEPMLIRGASIRLIGDATLGAYFCGFDGPFPLSLLLSASFPDTPSGSWIAEDFVPKQNGAFYMHIDFRAYRDPTWEFLMDGAGELKLMGGTGFLPSGCWIVTPPSATVTEAVLLIDADFPVPADQSTWGRIKALYE